MENRDISFNFPRRKGKKEKFKQYSLVICVLFSPASAKTFTIRYHLRGTSYNYNDIFAFLHERSSGEKEKEGKKRKERTERELSMFATSGIPSKPYNRS